jgi:hypothetical protein
VRALCIHSPQKRHHDGGNTIHHSNVTLTCFIYHPASCSWSIGLFDGILLPLGWHPVSDLHLPETII